jgi:hypothetical protein
MGKTAKIAAMKARMQKNVAATVRDCMQGI